MHKSLGGLAIAGFISCAAQTAQATPLGGHLSQCFLQGTDHSGYVLQRTPPAGA
jgi:hypothetical protein